MLKSYKESDESVIGKRFGKLVAIMIAGGTKRRSFLFKCDCGNEVIKDYYSVKYGLTRSCGCLYKKRK